ncbi:hypothetical protein M495_18885 [Serratia liquefaciens ATCC 27592]|nr:hypothetical protein M495_18885 [Serratia liquefaciens ATCC 27592]
MIQEGIVYNTYDSGFSLIGILIIWIAVVVISCVILFVLIRKAVKVNELIAVQNKILNQLVLQSEILSGGEGKQVSSFYLDEVRKWNGSDVIAKGGVIVSHPKVESIAKLHNDFINDVNKKGGSILSAKKLFKVEVDRITSGMDASQKEVFFRVYTENLN